MASKILRSAIMAAFFMAAQASAAMAAAYVITPQQETSLLAYIMDTNQVQKGMAGVEPVAEIQDNLMKDNGDIPRKEHGVVTAERALQPAQVVDAWIPNAFTFPDGLISFSQGLVEDASFNYVSTRYDNLDAPYFSVYGKSRIASVFAHELGHWEKNDYLDSLASLDIDREDHKRKQEMLSNSDWEHIEEELMNQHEDLSPKTRKKVEAHSLQREFEADKNSVRFLLNSEEYSPGSLIYFLEKHSLSDEQEASIAGSDDTIAPHPPTKERNQKMKRHIKNLSGGRVSLKEDDRLMLDSELLCGSGFAESSHGVDMNERTLFLAGQLAKAASMGMRDTETVLDGGYSRLYVRGNGKRFLLCFLRNGDMKDAEMERQIRNFLSK